MRTLKILREAFLMFIGHGYDRRGHHRTRYYLRGPTRTRRMATDEIEGLEPRLLRDDEGLIGWNCSSCGSLNWSSREKSQRCKHCRHSGAQRETRKKQAPLSRAAEGVSASGARLT